MLMRHEIEIAVRYYETDAQGVVHHAVYLQYFELGRVEFLRALGFDYADFERQGVFLVVIEVDCRYQRPCRFGDQVRLVTEIERVTPARIFHRYEVFGPDDKLCVRGRTTLACVDRDGVPQRIPAQLTPDEA